MKKIVLVVAVLAVVGLLAYSDSFNVPFQFDGLRQIAENPMIKNLDNFAPAFHGHALHPPAGFEYNNRRFFGYLSLALNYYFGGLDVAGYHIVNLAIHIMNAILVYLLIILTFKTPFFRWHSAEGIGQQAGKPASRQADKQQATSWQAGKQQAIECVASDLQPPTLNKGSLASNLQPLTSNLQPHNSRFKIQDSRYLIALFAALLFVAHPVQTQAVTYIVQRFTSLAAMFYLLSIVMYIKWRLKLQTAESIAHSAKREELYSRYVRVKNVFSSVPYALCSLLFAVCAMKTKEIAFTLPIIIVLYEFLFFKSSAKKKALVLIPVLLTLFIIPVSVMGTHRPLGDLLSDLSASTRVETNIPRWDYLMTQTRVITTYVRLLFFPVNQNLDYNYPLYHSLSQPPVLLSSLFLLSLMGLAGYLLYKSKGQQACKLTSLQADKQQATSGKLASLQADKRQVASDSFASSLEPPTSNAEPSAFCLEPQTSDLEPVTSYYRLISFGILWFFITLSVESSVIPIADVIFEHRVYLPSVGAFIAISGAALVAIRRIGRGRRVDRILIAVFSAVAIILLSGATFARNAVWKDPVVLWQDVVKKGPGNARGYNNLGYLYLMRGQAARSVDYFRKALMIRPYYANAHTNLGVAYYDRGRIDEAIGQFRTAVALESYGPDIAEDHHNLGIAFTRKGMLDEAISEYQEALKIVPRNAGIYSDLGVAYRRKGLPGKAVECFKKALQIDPGYVYAHLNLAQVYESEGRYDEARQHYSMARRLGHVRR